MPKYQVHKGHDAYLRYTAVVDANSIKEANQILANDEEELEWQEDYTQSFDDFEIFPHETTLLSDELDIPASRSENDLIQITRSLITSLQSAVKSGTGANGQNYQLLDAGESEPVILDALRAAIKTVSAQAEQYPLRRFFDTSIAHISRHTVDWLTAQADDSSSRHVIGKTPYGFFLHIPSDPLLDEFPEDLQNVLRYAKKAGAEYVLFDSDAALNPALPDLYTDCESAAYSPYDDAWVIYNTENPDLAWSNDLGWTDTPAFDVFPLDEKKKVSLPINGQWRLAGFHASTKRA